MKVCEQGADENVLWYMEEVTGGWKNLHSGGLHNSYQ
jgi:hypothetical protein